MKPALLSLVIAFVPCAASAQGDLTPPAGAPAAGMKTLTQIEPRIPISAAGTFNTPGNYYLTQNITVTTGDAIALGGTGSTLDLNGFFIESTSATATGTAIAVNASDITIRNGHILGTGFIGGIYSNDAALRNIAVRNVTVKGCSTRGIIFNTLSGGTLVESCLVQGISGPLGSGISAKIVRDSSALQCGYHGISAEIVSGCRASVISNSSSGSAGISANNVTNSYGETASSNTLSFGIGGQLGIVTDSQGIATAGTGVAGRVVTNCMGTATTGFGITGNSVTSSYGSATSGTGIAAATGTVSFSTGARTSPGVGILANNAIGCNVSGTGVTVTATNKSLGTP